MSVLKTKNGEIPSLLLVTLLLFIFTLFAILPSSSIHAATKRAQFIQGEWLVKLKNPLHEKSMEVLNLLEAHQMKIQQKISALNILVLKEKISLTHAIKIQKMLKDSELFDFVEPNYLARGTENFGIAHDKTWKNPITPQENKWIPNDPYFPLEWHLTTLGAINSWDITRGSGVTVAFIDSGVESTHPDLVGRIGTGWSFLSNTNDTSDVLGHGTGVAGAIGANANNGTGVAGLAPEISMMPLVVLDSNNYTTYANIASAITYAVDHGVRLINISIGGSSSSQTLQNAANYAWSKNALIFAAAMNNSNSTPMYPAATNHVVAVSATNSLDQLASFSNYGNWITLSSPGDHIDTTRVGQLYWFVWGTSFASPLAMTVAALCLSQRPDLTNQNLLDLLKHYSDDLGPAGFDESYGYGRVNALKALNALSTFPLPTPIPTATATPNPTVIETPNPPATATPNPTVTPTPIPTPIPTPVPPTDTNSPATQITSPNSGSVLSYKRSFTVSANASDDVRVTKVSLYINNKLKKSLTSYPYNFYIKGRSLSRGTYTLRTRAYDMAGNYGDSANVTIILR